MYFSIKQQVFQLAYKTVTTIYGHLNHFTVTEVFHLCKLISMDIHCFSTQHLQGKVNHMLYLILLVGYPMTSVQH